MANKKKELTQMDKVSAGFEDFMKRQKIKSISKKTFEQGLKKAITKKQSSSK